MRRRGRLTSCVAAVVALSVLAASCSLFRDEAGGDRADVGGLDVVSAWFDPSIAGAAVPLGDLCDRGACVEDVLLPQRRLVDTVVDVSMPETLGALAVERIWTGERTGLFGDGWESLWDLRIEDGRLIGPLPAAPRTEPAPGQSIALTDGTTLRFDDAGLLVESCPPGTHCATATRAADELVIESPLGRSVTMALTEGRVTSATTDDGRSFEYAYQDGFLESVANDGEERWRYEYDDGRVVTLEGPDGTRSLAYDDDGDVASMTDRDGLEWAFDIGGSTITVDAEQIGSSRTYRFEDDLLSEIVDRDLGPIVSRTIADGRVTGEARPLDGLTISYLDDRRVRVEQRSDDAPTRVVEHQYDDLGRMTEASGPDGTTLVSYLDDSPRPTAVTRNGGETSFDYDALGLLASITDADGYELALERDDDGQVVGISDGILSTALTYDDVGRVTQQGTDGRVAAASYDALGRVEEAATPSGSGVTYQYDEHGRLATLGAGAETQTFGYDENGSLSAAAVDALGLSALADEPISGVAGTGDSAPTVTPGDDGSSTYAYADGETITFDADGHPLETVVGGQRTLRTYDDAGRLATLQLPDGRSYELSYTDAGRIASIDTGGVVLEPSWHGDLLTSLTSSTGERYEYEWNATGKLVAASTAVTRWSYEYDAAGLLESVDGPAGRSEYGWSDEGQPEWSRSPGGDERRFSWDGPRLTEIAAAEQDITLQWEGDRLRGIDDGDDALELEYDTNGRVAVYDDGDDRTVVGYGPDGVDTIQRGDHTERWEHRDGHVAVVRVGDDADEVYEFDWVAPGLPRSVSHEGDELVSVSVEGGHVTSVSDGGDEPVATFDHDRGRVVSAMVDGETLTLERDKQLRLTRAEADGVDVEARYEDGAVASVRSGDRTSDFTYEDGDLTTSAERNEDVDTSVEWDERARPVAFENDEGSGAFAYSGDRVSLIEYDDKRRDVTYDDEGRPSADGTGGEFLDDLFTDTGRFSSPGDLLDEGPSTPLLDRLPGELGLTLPSVTTPDESVEATIEAAVPELPVPLAESSTDDFVARVVDVTLRSGASEPVPVGPASHRTFQFAPSDVEIDELFATTPTARVAASVTSRLAADPCLLCRARDAGTSVLSGTGSVLGTMIDLVRDNPAARTILSTSFLVASFAVSMVCGTNVVCAGALLGAAQVVTALLEGETSGLGVLYRATIGPVADAVAGLPSLEPNAWLQTASLIGGAVVLKRTGSGGALRQAAESATCSLDRVVCVPLSRWDDGARHILDAQRSGHGRVLRVDRVGASERRTDALRGIDRVIGLDRDEYPPAFARADGVMPSVRHIDPAINRGLGASLRHQTSLLDDGNRFWLRVTP